MASRSTPIDWVKIICALDIGTRSVVGLACSPHGDQLRVLATEIAFHPQRDMMDGQIHNIAGVADTVRQVKYSLEKRLGVPVEEVAVAAAGRALKTQQSFAEKELTPGQKIKREEVTSLELEALEKAKKKLSAKSTGYYCVGYTSTGYYLDDMPITSLIGQKGSKMGTRILATFLPNVVVEGLLTVIEEAGLSVRSLTLEPIAALKATIPPEYQMLNLALVDIGAGTSDIAITREGSVLAYAMVPMAGDEITEKIADTYLLSFNQAEEIKIKLTQKPKVISLQNILGIKHQLSWEQLAETISPVVEKIAANIANSILKFNEKPPRAVFLVGGGSQTLGLKEQVAEKLGLPPEKVVVKGREVISGIRYNGKRLKGPEGITPFAIALSAVENKYYGFSYVTVNGKVVRLLETERQKVVDALLAAGFSAKKIIGRRGKGISIKVQGKERYIPGEAGENARIYVNKKAGSLETPINNNDQIIIEEAVEGKRPTVKIKDLFPPDKFSIILNGSPRQLPPVFTVNGKEASLDTILSDNDEVELKGLGSLEDFCRLAELDWQKYQFLLGGKEVEASYILQPGDELACRLRQKSSTSPPQAHNQAQQKAKPPAAHTITVQVNNQKVTIKSSQKPSFVDIFNYIDFDRSKPQGRLIMSHNGSPASLTSPLKDGDKISIYWDKEQG